MIDARAPAFHQGVDLLASLLDPVGQRIEDTYQEAVWRARIRDDLAAGRMTPDTVAAYAGLHLRREDGSPIQPAAHHRLWLELLCDDSIPSLLILAPPEAAKTTWIVSAWAGCRIGFFPEEPIIVCSETGPTARKRVNSLRTQVQTLSWRSTFRTVRPAEGLPFRQEEWSVAPNGIPRPGRLHPTAAAFGVDGSVTGARGKVIIGDDIVSRRNSKTAYQREEVKAFVYSTLKPRLMAERGAREVFIGTPYHPDDVYADFQDSGEYVICKTPALGDGPSYYATLSYPGWWSGETMGEPHQRAEEAPEWDSA